MSIHNFSNFENLNILFTTIGNKLKGKLETVNLTQAQYDALTPAEKMNGKAYFITDAESGLAPSSGSGGGSESYSTDEQECGTWVDGSTIYKKTFVLPTNYDTSISIDIEVNNIDKIIKYEGGVCYRDNKYSEHAYKNFDSYGDSNNNGCAVFIYKQDASSSVRNKIKINLSTTFNTGFYGHITIWYTKSA